MDTSHHRSTSKAFNGCLTTIMAIIVHFTIPTPENLNCLFLHEGRDSSGPTYVWSVTREVALGATSCIVGAIPCGRPGGICGRPGGTCGYPGGAWPRLWVTWRGLRRPRPL